MTQQTIPMDGAGAAAVNGRLVIASVSGGKDSGAMALLLKELEIPHERIFMDTGWEHPRHYQIRTMEHDLTRRGHERDLEKGRAPVPRTMFWYHQGTKHIPIPIDDAVQWANSKRGEWRPATAGDGCARLGMCAVDDDDDDTPTTTTPNTPGDPDDR